MKRMMPTHRDELLIKIQMNKLVYTQKVTIEP